MTEPNSENHPWQAMTDEEVADYIHRFRQQMTELREYSDRLELELIQRLEQRKARELQHPSLQVYLDYRTAQYDVGKLMRLAELVPPEDWAKAWHPETTKEAPVPAGLDMRVAGAWRKRFGIDVGAVLDEAQLPSTPRLVIKDKPLSHESRKEVGP